MRGPQPPVAAPAKNIEQTTNIDFAQRVDEGSPATPVARSRGEEGYDRRNVVRCLMPFPEGGIHSEKHDDAGLGVSRKCRQPRAT
jgi:hypothetical protein